jgi:dTDP-4-amino-4,6-dideoxygalactose transaminase
MINPVHHSDHFKPQFENNEFLNSVNISKQSAHLPSGLKLTENHISKVANKIVEYFLSIE